MSPDQSIHASSFKAQKHRGIVKSITTHTLYFVDTVFNGAVDYRVVRFSLYRNKNTGKYYLYPEYGDFDKTVTIFNDDSDRLFTKESEYEKLDYDNYNINSAYPVKYVVDKYQPKLLFNHNGITRVTTK